MPIEEKQFGSTIIKKYHFPEDHWAATLPLAELPKITGTRMKEFQGIEGCWIPWTLAERRMALELNQASGVPTGDMLRALLKRLHTQYLESKETASGNAHKPSV
ncbi:MAG: hypothetical protein EON54_03455 [Alcaligenaceae bacterium]|nr:MAG: hypothetical protein EON54_03455 [Alcaligenaceae bacterium]